MPFMININNIINNGVTQNGNVNIGPTTHNSHTANTKFVGTNNSFGNLSPSTGASFNGVLDTDVSDQDQIMNPSAPVVNQL